MGYKKGESGNPGGKSAVAKLYRQLSVHKNSEYYEKFIFWCDAPPGDIKNCEGAPWPIATIDKIICKTLFMALKGNLKAFEMITNRVMGKPKESVEVNSSHKSIALTLPDGELESYFNEIRAFRLEKKRFLIENQRESIEIPD